MFMKFNLNVHLRIEGTGVSSGGTFKARTIKDIPKVVYDYIKYIKYETGYRTMVIEKVLVDGTEDITELVREIDGRPAEELPDVFW